jgi:hypothetical protein
LIATAALAAQYAGTLELLDTSRVDGVAVQPPPLTPSGTGHIAIAGTVSTTPTARLRLRNRRWDWLLSYSPALALGDIELLSGTQPLIMNTAVASVGWTDRLVTLRLTETATYGVQSLIYAYTVPLPAAVAAMPTMPVTPGMPMPPTMTPPAGQPASNLPATTFESGSSNTAGTIAWRPSRRITNTLFGGYNIAGNLSNNPQSAVVLPLQYGPFGSYTFDYAASPNDSLVTRLNAQYTTTPQGLCTPPAATTCRIEAPFISLEEAARRRLSETATVSVGAGASAAIIQSVNGPAWAILPIADVRFVDQLGPAAVGGGGMPAGGGGAANVLTLSATLAPAVDINTGQINNLVQVNATVTKEVAQHVFLTLGAGAMHSVPPSSYTMEGVNGAVSARWSVSRQIDLGCGFTGFYQTQDYVVGTNTIPQNNSVETGYVSVLGRLPILKF